MIHSEAVIVGKGPSGSRINWKYMPDFRIGINEAALSIPDCSAAICLDPRVWDVLIACMSTRTEFWHPRHIHVKWPNRYVFESFGEESLSSSIRVCHQKGIGRIVLVGCDALITPLRYPKYKEVVKQVWRALRDTRIKYEFA